MANTKYPQKPKSQLGTPILFLALSITGTALLFLLYSFNSTTGFSFASPKVIPINPTTNTRSSSHGRSSDNNNNDEKFLYWGYKIDCPGKHCDTCAGLGHQESSLRCALEEAMFLQRFWGLGLGYN